MEAARAINKAISYCTLLGDFRADLVEASIAVDPTLYGDTISLATLTRFRKFTYVKPTAVLRYLTQIHEGNVCTPANNIQPDRYYLAGTNMTYTLKEVTSLLEVGYLTYPPTLDSVTNTTHWMLDQIPYAIIDLAASYVFAGIGDDASARRHEKDGMTPERRGRAFGLHRAMDSLGAVAGPLIALYVMSRLGEDAASYRTIFRWALVPALLGVAILFAVRERPFTPRLRAPSFGWRTCDRDFRIFILANLVFAIGNSSDAFLILRARDLFSSPGNTMATVIVAYVRYNLTYALGSYPAGVLADRIGPRRVFAAGLVLFALVYLGFALNRDPRLVWVLFAVYAVWLKHK